MTDAQFRRAFDHLGYLGWRPRPGLSPPLALAAAAAVPDPAWRCRAMLEVAAAARAAGDAASHLAAVRAGMAAWLEAAAAGASPRGEFLPEVADLEAEAARGGVPWDDLIGLVAAADADAPAPATPAP